MQEYYYVIRNWEKKRRRIPWYGPTDAWERAQSKIVGRFTDINKAITRLNQLSAKFGSRAKAPDFYHILSDGKQILLEG